jgi:EmrB/QacA subfamily drug resistance transporter
MAGGAEDRVAPGLLPPATEGRAAPGAPSERLLLATVALGGMLAPLNSTMIAVALPDIRDQFALSHTAIAWLVSSYLITMAVAQPVAGSLGDRLGRARVLRIALVAFLVASLAATLAPTFELLVALRIAQAAAGAALIPNGMALLRIVVPEHRLGRVNGLFNSMIAVAAASGPLVGAVLLEASSWRLLFLLSVPVVAVALLLHSRLRGLEEPTADRGPIDWPGIVLLTAVLTGVSWLFGALDGAVSPLVTGVVVVAVAAATMAFVRRQFVARAPVVPWGLFRRRSFAAASIYTMVSNLVLYTSLLTIPFFIREVQQGGAARIGLLLGAMTVLMAVLAPVSGRLADAVGRRLPALAGGALALGGALLVVAGIDADVSFAYLAVSLALLGAGIGLGTGAATTAAVEAAPIALAGSASGTNSMMRYIGSIVGAGVLAGLLGSAGGTPGVGVFQAVFVVVVVMAVITVVSATAIHVRAGDGMA